MGHSCRVSDAAVQESFKSALKAEFAAGGVKVETTQFDSFDIEAATTAPSVMRPGECTTTCVAASMSAKTGVQPFDTESPMTSTAGNALALARFFVQSSGPDEHRYDTLQLSPCSGPHRLGGEGRGEQPCVEQLAPLGQQ